MTTMALPKDKTRQYTKALMFKPRAIAGIVIIIVALAIIILIGWLVLRNHDALPSPHQFAPVATSTDQVATTTATITPTDPDSICQASTTAEVASNGTKYQKGTIIVVFLQSVTFDQASSELNGYGYSAVADDSSQTAFTTNHTITANVPTGQEIAALCDLKQDAIIKNAALNTIFTLHE